MRKHNIKYTIKLQSHVRNMYVLTPSPLPRPLNYSIITMWTFANTLRGMFIPMRSSAHKLISPFLHIPSNTQSIPSHHPPGMSCVFYFSGSFRLGLCLGLTSGLSRLSGMFCEYPKSPKLFSPMYCERMAWKFGSL